MNCKYLRLLLFYLSLFVLPGSSWLRAQLPGIPEEIQLETITIPGGSESNMADRMMQDSLGFIWFPTRVGLYRYDGTKFRHYPLSENGSPANIESVIVDRVGNYWAGSRHGLYRLDAASGEFEHFIFTGNPGVGSPNRITDLAEGPDGRIWMATLGGILAFDPDIESFEHFDEIQVDGESFPLVYSETVLTDQTGNIWFGAGYAWQAGGAEAIGGLLRFVPEQNNFEAFFLDHKEKTGIDAPNISSLYEDRQGYLWVGTARRNLYR